MTSYKLKTKNDYSVEIEERSDKESITIRIMDDENNIIKTMVFMTDKKLGVWLSNNENLKSSS